MKKRINISVDELMLKWLKEYAKKRYTSVSRIIAEWAICAMNAELQNDTNKRRQK